MRKYNLTLLGIALIMSACASVPKTTATQVVETAQATNMQTRILGAPLPLVCQHDVAAEGALQKRPNTQIMWENFIHDKPEGVWREIGGLVEVNGNLPFDQGRWTNACTVRLSYMLNQAGHYIPRIQKKTVSGANREQYYYRVADIEEYLKSYYGAPDIAITDGSGNGFDLPDTAGIVLMDFPNSSFTGHVTIWNGAGTVDGVNIGGYRVLFWHLPCFIPKNRELKLSSLNTNDEHLP